jgi:hypothetical protein
MESTSPLTEFWVLEVVGTPSPARVDPAIALLPKQFYPALPAPITIQYSKDREKPTTT